MKLWQKVIGRDLVGTFLFVLLAIFALYVIVDLAESAKQVRAAMYYLGTFSLYLDIFFPLAFLLASLKVLLHLNLSHQLIALQMSGLSKKTVLLPFFALSFVLALLSLLNAELLFPKAYELIAPLKKNKTSVSHLHSTTLDDGSRLIYQSFDSKKQELFDVVWIQERNQITLIKHLSLSHPPLARDSHHLVRSKHWEKKASFAEERLPHLQIDPSLLSERPSLYESRSLSSLMGQLKSKVVDRAAIRSHLFYKIARALLCPFLLVVIASPLMRFARQRSLLLPFSCALFGFFGFLTILDGMLLLSETGVMPALVAIGAPFGACLLLSLRPFIKLR